MTLVSEVRDALKAVREIVESARVLVKAVSDGREYLRARHPKASRDLAKLLVEVDKTIVGLAEVSGVITHFKFTVDGAGRDLEPREFNNYYIASKRKIQNLRRRQRTLRGSCKKIAEHERRLSEQAGGFWRWPLLLRVNAERRRQELAGQLQFIFGADQQIIELTERLVNAVETTLADVSDALGPGATQDPANVPAAARLLTEYGDAFAAVERQLLDLAGEFAGQIDELR